MAAIMRAYDWSATPLGPTGMWPPALCTLVGVMLNSRQPMFIAWGPQRVMLYNDGYVPILGGRHPTLGKTFAQTWFDIMDTVGPILERAFAGEATHMDDIAFIMHRNGFPEETHFAFSYTPVRDESGEVAGMFCACTETTAEVIAARELREGEARLRGVLEGMAEGFVMLDRDFRVLEINEAGLQLDQRERDAIVGKTHWEAWPGAEESQLGQFYKGAMVDRTPIEFENSHVWEDGHQARMEVRAYPTEDGLGIFYRDISDRKANEDALRASEARLALSEESLRLSTDAAEVGAWDFDLTTDVLTWSDRTKAMFGISPEVPCSMHDFYAGLHPDDRETTSAAFASAVDPEIRATYDVEYRTIGKEDGVVRWVAAKGKGLFDGNSCVRAIGTAIEITDRKRAQARQRFLTSLAECYLKSSKPREIVAAAVEGLGRHLGVSRVGFGEFPGGIETVVFETDYVDGVSHLVGTFPSDAFGRENIADLARGLTTVYPDLLVDARTSEAGEFATIDTRAAMAVPLIREARLSALLYLNHREVREWTSDEVTLVQDVAARTWDALERARAEAGLRELNATLERRVEERTAELLRAEEALRQAQKMEAVGQLTGGIAHDFNNMLAVVIGSLDLLKRRVGASDARASRYVDAATDGARRAAMLTQRLLAFSRQQPLKPETIDANKLVAGMSDLLRHSLGGEVQLETVLAGGLWRVNVDPNQLENVLLNLAINARDAMVDGGRLTIETQNAHLDGRYAAAHLGVPAGQYVLIAVTDTGTGMPEGVIAKAFDPFFTTKEVGKGTGLGLSQVYGFVKQSGGHVKIYSEPGQGTSVKVYLPRLVGAELELPEDGTQTDLPLGDSQELILVVEDEPAVRQFSVDALTELGYRVIEADGAAAALRLLDARPDIALMFTDIVMPEVNGAKLAEEARRRRPDLKVLFTTGYTRNAVVHNGVLDAGVELIGKPFTIEELAAKVREALDGPSRQDSAHM